MSFASISGNTFGITSGHGLADQPISSHAWALILAGGEGTRLRKLTTTHCGTAVPKQFCSLAGGRTLLQDAIARAQGCVADERICTIVAQQHRQWWSSLLADRPARNLIVQPRGRGTGIGVLYSALHIAARDPQAVILILPSDHHVRDESVLRPGLRAAMSCAQQSGQPVLVGLEPARVDCELGYILPGEHDQSDTQTQSVARFIEKPDFSVANAIVSEGALWNTFILAASAQALINLFMKRYAPIVLEMRVILSRALSEGAPGAGWPALVDLYERLPVLDFSADLLEGSERGLRVLRVADCGWSDLGTPVRVAETLRAMPQEYPSRYDQVSTPFVNLAAQHALQEHRVDSASS